MSYGQILSKMLAETVEPSLVSSKKGHKVKTVIEVTNGESQTSNNFV